MNLTTEQIIDTLKWIKEHQKARLNKMWNSGDFDGWAEQIDLYTKIMEREEASNEN